MTPLPERPDLSDLPSAVTAYIEALERALEEAEADAFGASGAFGAGREAAPGGLPAAEPSEPPTTVNVITITARGAAKRTPRHFYSRQRRGGMGVFGVDLADDDPPVLLTLADASAWLTLVTNQGRAFRVAVADVMETPIAGRGRPLLNRFPLRGDERLSLAIPDPLTARSAYLALVTQRGQVRRIGSQYLGKQLQPGTVLYNVAEGGPPAAACWTAGNDELFIATRTGAAIRFAERLVPVRGCLGLRVDPQDAVVGVAATDAQGGVFLLGQDGKGTIRLLEGFTANKAPGSGGKVAIRVDRLVGAAAVGADDDVLILSSLGKVIRFPAHEIPAKEGVVQGVNCMALRADECVALAISPGVG
jgi:DNA gyrase subunit A